MKLTAYPQHYCGKAHNPKYPCPAETILFGGVPANQLPICMCSGSWHAPDCKRRAAIEKIREGWAS